MNNILYLLQILPTCSEILKTSSGVGGLFFSKIIIFNFYFKLLFNRLGYATGVTKIVIFLRKYILVY